MGTDDPQGTQHRTAPLVGNSHVMTHALESALGPATEHHPHPKAAQKLMDSIALVDDAVRNNIGLPAMDRVNRLPTQVDYRMYQQQLAGDLDALIQSEFVNAG